MMGRMLEVNRSPVNANQGGRQEPSATVERLKAACSLEAPLFDDELYEFLRHVTARTPSPPRLSIRVAAFRKRYRLLQKRLSCLLPSRSSRPWNRVSIHPP